MFDINEVTEVTEEVGEEIATEEVTEAVVPVLDMTTASASVLSLVKVAEDVALAAAELQLLESGSLEAKSKIRTLSVKVRASLVEAGKLMSAVYKGKDYEGTTFPGVVAIRDGLIDSVGSVKKANALAKAKERKAALEAEIAALEALEAEEDATESID